MTASLIARFIAVSALPLPFPAVSAVDHFSGQICGRRQRLRCRPRRLLHRTAYWQRMGQNRLGTCHSAASPSSLSSPDPSVAASVTAPRTNVRVRSLQQENDEAEENKKRRNVSVRPLTPQTMQQFYLTRLPIPSHLPQLHPGR